MLQAIFTFPPLWFVAVFGAGYVCGAFWRTVRRYLL